MNINIGDLFEDDAFILYITELDSKLKISYFYISKYNHKFFGYQKGISADLLNSYKHYKVKKV